VGYIEEPLKSVTLPLTIDRRPSEKFYMILELLKDSFMDF